ncbi:AcvB/VirJ family lysyl-phosphatidylglycerol hydrolase [Kaistella sp.]|uniref:AcvB/VirJ family lysyl-phosphatidylglycerol hydrolase n=1 Tax=Kaistella sp. TaxID=2782235 RepID=UPI003C4BC080
MKKLAKVLSLFSLLLLFSCLNSDSFPVVEWNGNSDKPIVFYISGDGGFNTFSKTFAQEIHRYGYDVFALNTKKYFWKKKTPLQASQDTENYLKQIIQNRINKKIIIIGYSYGADVAPFIYNRFDRDFQKNIQKLIIIGPSRVNDFEIHLEEYVTGHMEYGYSVVNEINHLKNVPFTLVVSDLEKEYFPKNEITLKDYQFLHLQGDHHFGGKTKMLADSLIKYF